MSFQGKIWFFLCLPAGRWRNMCWVSVVLLWKHEKKKTNWSSFTCYVTQDFLLKLFRFFKIYFKKRYKKKKIYCAIISQCDAPTVQTPFEQIENKCKTKTFEFFCVSVCIIKVDLSQRFLFSLQSSSVELLFFSSWVGRGRKNRKPFFSFWLCPALNGKFHKFRK